MQINFGAFLPAFGESKVQNKNNVPVTFFSGTVRETKFGDIYKKKPVDRSSGSGGSVGDVNRSED